MLKLDGIRGIDELELAHQRVLIRVDFNAPLGADGEPLTDSHVQASLPTIKKALAEGARVILASHLGRPEGQKRPELSLDRVGLRLAELLGQEVYLPDECFGDAARKVVSDLRGGQLCLLENLRFFEEEERNDEGFARKLGQLCDVYVNEAFACSHRPHASLVALPRLFQERGAGYLLKAELEGLARVANAPGSGLVALLGGAKLSDKLELIEALLPRCSALCVGGGVANTLLAARSVDMKESLVEREQLALGRALLERARDRKVELLLPVDVLVAEAPESGSARLVSIGSIPDGHGAFDIGPRTVAAFAARMAGAKTVFWNGPLGFAESSAFQAGSAGVAQAIADAAGFSVVAGAATVQALAAAGPEVVSKISFVSTGGAASLELIQGKKLPGVEALRG